MEIVVLVLGIVGFIMSWVIVGAIPAALAIVLGPIRLMIKKKPLRKLGRFEITLGIVFAIPALIISIYFYFMHFKGIDFIEVIKMQIDVIVTFFKTKIIFW